MATKKPAPPILVRRVWRGETLLLDIIGGALPAQASQKLGIDVMGRNTGLTIELYDPASAKTFPPVKFGAASTSST